MKRNPKDILNDGRLTLNLDELAALLGLSRTYVYARANRGDLPGAFRLGRRWLVSRKSIDSLLNVRYGGPMTTLTPLRPDARCAPSNKSGDEAKS
jgi:excisionase family DNA binding protein